MSKSPEQPSNREKVGRGIKTGGLVGMIIGIAALNLEIAIFSAAALYGGRKIEGKKK